MKKLQHIISRRHMRFNIAVLSAILAVFLITTLLQAVFTWKSINDELENRKKMEVNVQNERIDALKQSVASIVENSAPAFEQELENPKQITQLLTNMMRQNPELLGSAVAFVPDYHSEQGRLYAPYVYRENDIIRTKVLKYDYTQFEWYSIAIENDKRDWCHPYADQDGTYALMTTYSVPLHNTDGKVVAVLTGDLPMSELSYVTNTIYHKSSMRSIIILGMQIFGILLIIVIVWGAVVNMRKIDSVNKQNEFINDELIIASNLQTAILPREYPQHANLRMRAMLKPAAQVSGDFYDFSLQGDKLNFCIGDVATQGIGAALAMIITRSVYRTCIKSHDDLKSIMNKMNDSLVSINEQHMYATFFAGQLDLQTGHLTYCNAGHLPPYLLGQGEARQMDICANVPLGITEWDFETQEMQLKAADTLFLYTDGIVEAMNVKEESFGEKRLALHLKKAGEHAMKPDAVMKQVNNALQHHLGIDQEAKDDLTMLVISWQS